MALSRVSRRRTLQLSLWNLIRFAHLHGHDARITIGISSGYCIRLFRTRSFDNNDISCRDGGAQPSRWISWNRLLNQLLSYYSARLCCLHSYGLLDRLYCALASQPRNINRVARRSCVGLSVDLRIMGDDL